MPSRAYLRSVKGLGPSAVFRCRDVTAAPIRSSRAADSNSQLIPFIDKRDCSKESGMFAMRL